MGLCSLQWGAVFSVHHQDMEVRTWLRRSAASGCTPLQAQPCQLSAENGFYAPSVHQPLHLN